MSNSTDNTNDLDSYGVWVKKGPEDQCEEALDLDLPDFSELDGQTAEAEEHTEIADSEESSEDADTSAAEDIAIDDFIADGFTDPNEAFAPSSPNPPEQDGEISLDDFMDSSSDDSGSSDEISLDDFLGGDGGSSSDEISIDDFLGDDFGAGSSSQKEDDIANDEPLDINVSFNESEEDAVPTEDITEDDESSSDEEQPSAEDDMFGAIEPAPETAAPETTQEESNIELEDVSLDDFNLDESDDATAAALGASINSSAGEEDVSLDEFGEISSDSRPSRGPKQVLVDYDLAITEDDNIQSAPVINEIKSDANAPDKEDSTETTAVNNELLEKIVSDLSGLKEEINSLKQDLATLKERSCIENIGSAPQAAETEVPDSSFEGQETEIPSEPAVIEQPEESGGFFTEDEEDDTIALSGDELSNIVNNADFTEEPASPAPDCSGMPEEPSETEAGPEISDGLPEETFTEPEIQSETEAASDSSDTAPFSSEVSSAEQTDEPDSGLSLTMNDENLEEPDLDSISPDEDIPDEIEIPKVDDIANSTDEEPAVDDILVESSASDFMESNADAITVPPAHESIEPESIADEAADVNTEEGQEYEEPVFESNAAEEETASEMQLNDETAQDFSEESSENTAAVSEESVSEERTIQEEPVVSETEAAQLAQNEIMEDIMSESPSVDNALSEENVDYLSKDDAIISADTEAAEEAFSAEPEAPETETSGLPSDIKADVKSVLLYMDQLLENLPEEKIMEFAKSEQFVTYKKLFNELGLS